MGSLCLGFWSNLYATLSFSDITKNLLAVGTARQQDALVAALFFYGVGFILLVMGYTRVAEIKAEVDFGGGRPRYTLAKIIFKTVVILALLAGAFWLGRYSLSAAPTKL